MKNNISIFIICLTLFACSSSLSVLRKNDSLNINIENSKEAVLAQLGKPSFQNDTLLRYNEKGLLIYLKQSKVNEIICTQIFENPPFNGTFFGVRIGETNPKIIQTLGDKYKKSQISTEIYALTWQKGKINIEIEFWENSEVNQQVHYELIDTSKRIKVY